MGLWFFAMSCAKDGDCVERAGRLVKTIETLEPHRRRAAIELSVKRDPDVFCGALDVPIAPPAGCFRDARASCQFPNAFATSTASVSFDVWIQVETIAARLAVKGRSKEHERLLRLWLEASALREEH